MRAVGYFAPGPIAAPETAPLRSAVMGQFEISPGVQSASMVGISAMGGYHVSEQMMPLPEGSSDDPDTARPSVEQPEKPTL